MRSVGHDLYRMLRAGMPPEWTQGERLVALIVADNCNDRTHAGYIANEDLCEETGYAPAALSDVLRRLSRRGYEMRVPHGTGKDGRLVFSARGHGVDYRVPLLPPRSKAPSGPGLNGAGPVDNHPRKVPSGPGLSSERPRPDRQRPRPPGAYRAERPRPDGTPTPTPATQPNPNNQRAPVVTTSVEVPKLSTGQEHDHGNWPAPRGRHAAKGNT